MGKAARYLRWGRYTGLLALALLAGCAQERGGDAASAARQADTASGADWAGYGRTNGQQHYSPLDEVNESTVGKLGLAWSMDLPFGNSATEPIAVDGVLYFASGLSIVNAVDAASGKLLWRYDPEVGSHAGLNLRVGWGVRGVGWWNGKIFVGTQDGRLIALDAANGKPLWTAQTFRPEDPAYISGAPRVFNGRVLIGFGGTTGVMRGYVTAYDAETGRQLWRFWTIPGDPEKGFENKAMEMAAKTWSGEWWKTGGGAPVWNSMAWDPETDTVFIGTGSPYPWNHRIRSQGKGDNLFVGSIVALDGRTGEYRWHYQPTPGDTWDFDATMDIELANLEIAGKPRKVLMQAPKNGFFYVIDRVTGELLSAQPYARVTWASHVDMKTGRPVEAPGARFADGKPAIVAPSSVGAHNWMPMAFSPRTGMVYIPAIDFEGRYSDMPGTWKPVTDRTFNGGELIEGGPALGMRRATGSLLAWSPAQGKAVWRVPHQTYLNGGVLATGGGLVFQGTVDGGFTAYAAGTGKTLWRYDGRAPIIAPPITYRAKGRQYVTVLTGLGMGISPYASSMYGPEIERYGIDPRSQARRVLTFALGGTATLPQRSVPPPPPADPGFRPDRTKAQAGMVTFTIYCSTCHGDMAVGINNGPDLRRSPTILDAEGFRQIVHSGILESAGMPKFPELDGPTLEDLRHFLRSRAGDLRDPARPAATPGSTGRSGI
ncbi:MAG: PQQ-dependent dehydrogenase, methanol/ethanol family [Novosphingobium sp.]